MASPIKALFANDINRPIEEVIKVDQFAQGRSSQYQRVPKSASDVGFCKIGATSRTCG